MSEESTVVVVSTSETIKDIFPDWLRLAYDGNQYEPYDLNMPLSIPKRLSSHYQYDSPITENGDVIAKLTARAMQDANFKADSIYSSPDLASIQTALSFIKGFNNNNLKINVEPGISCWRLLEPENIPDQWMTIDKLCALKYPINLCYEPQKSVQAMKNLSNETLFDYQNRIKLFHSFVKSLEKNSLIVADSGMLLVCEENEEITSVPDFLEKRNTKLPCTLDFIFQSKMKPFSRSLSYSKIMKQKQN